MHVIPANTAALIDEFIRPALGKMAKAMGGKSVEIARFRSGRF
jgi:hypothetical protein